MHTCRYDTAIACHVRKDPRHEIAPSERAGFPVNPPSTTNTVSQGNRSSGTSFATVLAQTATRTDEASAVQWRTELLARLGYTQARLAAMSPQERKALEKKLADLMNKSGSAAESGAGAREDQGGGESR